MERQWFSVQHFPQWKCSIVTFFTSDCIEHFVGNRESDTLIPPSEIWPWIVFLTILGYPAAVRVGTDPQAPVQAWNCQATQAGWLTSGWYPDRTKTCSYSTGLEPDCSSNFTVPTTFLITKSLSSDHIVTWLVPRLCSRSSSFTSRFQICNPTDTCWVAGKYVHNLCEIRGIQ